MAIRRRVLCIAGMHRSGTSLTASWLQGCGLAIDNGRLLGAAAHNPRGHFEDWDLLAYHRQAITAQVQNSNGWKAFERRPLRFDWSSRAGLALEVAKRTIKYPTWGFKDPRSALFLDEWRWLVPGIRTLIVWRPAFEVVTSLERRSLEASRQGKHAEQLHVAADEGLLIWRAYNGVLLDYARRHPRTTIVTSLLTLLADDRSVFDRINALLGKRLSYSPLSRYADHELLHMGSGPADPLEHELAGISLRPLSSAPQQTFV
jgi:hypothetical protein